MNHEEHERLNHVLKDIKGKFILSYNDCEYIWERYENFHIEAIGRIISLPGTRIRIRGMEKL